MRLLFPILLVCAGPAFAAWPPDGVRLTGAPDEQVGPSLLSDGAGGAFISWADWRNFSSTNSGHDLYLQRITANGTIAPGWPVDGLAVAVGPRTQGSIWRMALDGNGGVLIVYMDTRADAGDVYLQRINAAGTVAPGWPAGGVPVGVGPREQVGPEVASDGSGGAWVTWQDTNGVMEDSFARITHVLADGQIAPGWPAGGRLFEPSAVFTGRPLMLASGSGGFLAVWTVVDDPARSAVRILAQRFLADGTADPSWPAGGLVACTPQWSSRDPVVRLVPDATGGCYTVLLDYRLSPLEARFDDESVYAQHILGDGTIAPGWPADALPIGALSGVTEQGPDLCEDGAGGLYVAWEDYRSGYARVFAQHVTAAGQVAPGWLAGGSSFTSQPALQLSPRVAWDGARGMHVTWMTVETTYRSYVQHLSSIGTPMPGWPTNGLPVIPFVAATEQYVPRIVSDGVGGAIVAWEDTRDLERDIYAQRFITNGVVAAKVSNATAEVGPEGVRLRWHVSGESRASIERRDGDAAVWRALATRDVDGAGYVEYVDREVTPGADYEYRLAFALGAHGGETSVRVPALELAFEGARPNPAVGAVWVAFTLPDAKAARLELYDLVGRRLAAREVGAHGAGRHVVRLDDGRLAPGLYWASLTQGPRTLRVRVAVVR